MKEGVKAMNEFKTSMTNTLDTSGCEALKTSASRVNGFENLYGQKMGKLTELYGVDYPDKPAFKSDNNFSFEDPCRVVIDCDEITFLTDCARIKLKSEDLSRFVDKTKRIVINGASFVKEGGSGGSE